MTSLMMTSELNALFADFLWTNTPPRFRREILEVENRDGGLKLHNNKLFVTALKVGWLKRFIKSSSKWTVFSNAMELGDVFTDYIDRIVELTSNPFRKYVRAALKHSGVVIVSSTSTLPLKLHFGIIPHLVSK